MKEKILAKRYADAFLGVSRETIGTDRAIDELKELKVIFRTNPQLGGFLNNPQIGFSEKDAAIDKIFGKDFSQGLRQLLKLLVKNGRIKYIIDICDYVRVAYSYGEAFEAVLKTSYPLDLEMVKKIKTKLENKLHKKLNLYIELAPDLLGGVQVRIGNTIIDGSVKKRLVELRKKLLQS